jgi:hypothetical protein
VLFPCQSLLSQPAQFVFALLGPKESQDDTAADYGKKNGIHQLSCPGPESRAMARRRNQSSAVQAVRSLTWSRLPKKLQRSVRAPQRLVMAR